MTYDHYNTQSRGFGTPRDLLVRRLTAMRKEVLHLKMHNDSQDIIMGVIASQITSLTIVYSNSVYSDADRRKHQSSASLAFVRGIHRGPVNSPHKWPVTRKMFPFIFYDVIMESHPATWSPSH